MPIEVRWDNPEKTIIYTQVTGTWTWDEMYRVSETSILMRKSVSHRVGSIVEFRTAKPLPSGAISHAKNIISKQELYAGTTVFIGSDFVSISLWNVLMSVYQVFIRRQDFQFAASLEEARAILSQADAQQPTPSQTLVSPLAS